MRAVDFYRLAYAPLRTVTPIAGDCGALCDGACCAVEEEITGMYLFPGEEACIHPLPHWAALYDTDFQYGGKTATLFTCTGTCERALRPLACRIFPLVPYLKPGKKLEIRMDPRGRAMCPLTRLRVADLDPAFVRAVRCSMAILARNSQCRTFLYALADLLDDFA